MVTLLLVLAAFVGGCAHRQIDLIKDGTFVLEKNPEGYSHFRNIHAYEEQEELAVAGYIRGLFRSGHVDVEILGPERTVIAQKCLDVRRRTGRRSRTRDARFEARFAVHPPAGSVIRVVHEQRRHSGGGGQE